MDLLNEFQQHIKEQGLFQPADELLVAISGGIYFIVLTHLLYYSGYEVSLAHMIFHLRGDESKRDENFVKEVAE